jgi:hypothetical protein
MIVQWAVKGLSLPDDAAARAIIDDRHGLVCNWWRRNEEMDPAEITDKLTARNLDLHINHFTEPDPVTQRPFNEQTPFISLTAGTVERDAAARTNYVHRARRTALWFATEFGRRTTAYLYICWVILAPRASVEIEHLAEEVRDLNVYRHYSPFQTEGEVVAKIQVPDNQIARYEKWELDTTAVEFFRQVDSYRNKRFVNPSRLTNVRELI